MTWYRPPSPLLRRPLADLCLVAWTTSIPPHQVLARPSAVTAARCCFSSTPRCVGRYHASAGYPSRYPSRPPCWSAAGASRRRNPYGPCLNLVETSGLEPPTPCVQSRCSSQLSYVPRPVAPSQDVTRIPGPASPLCPVGRPPARGVTGAIDHVGAACPCERATMCTWSAALIAKRPCQSGPAVARSAVPAWKRPCRSPRPRRHPTSPGHCRLPPARTRSTTAGPRAGSLPPSSRPPRLSRVWPWPAVGRPSEPGRAQRSSRPGPALRSFTLIYAGQARGGGRAPRWPADLAFRCAPKRGHRSEPLHGVAFVRRALTYLLTPPIRRATPPAGRRRRAISHGVSGHEEGRRRSAAMANSRPPRLVYQSRARPARRSPPSGSFLLVTSRWGNSSPSVPMAFCAAGRPDPAIEPTWDQSLATPPVSLRVGRLPAWPGSHPPTAVPRTENARSM